MQEQTLVPTAQFPELYNHRVYKWRLGELNLKSTDIARLIGGRRGTVAKVFKGHGSNKIAYKVADALGLDWAAVHDLDLPEHLFPLAVRYGASGGRQLIAPQEGSGNSP